MYQIYLKENVKTEENLGNFHREPTCLYIQKASSTYSVYQFLEN